MYLLSKADNKGRTVFLYLCLSLSLFKFHVSHAQPVRLAALVLVAGKNLHPFGTGTKCLGRHEGRSRAAVGACFL